MEKTKEEVLEVLGKWHYQVDVTCQDDKTWARFLNGINDAIDSYNREYSFNITMGDVEAAAHKYENRGIPA